MSQSEATDQERIPVRITLPNGQGTRKGWHEPWRHLLIWKEPAERDDLDEFGQPEGWYWAHLHDSEATYEPV